MPAAPVLVLSQRPLAPSVASVTLVANDKGVHRSPGICLIAEKNPRKPSAKRPSDEGAVRPVIISNGVHFVQMRLVGLHSTSGREKEGIGIVGSDSYMKGEGRDWDSRYNLFLFFT